MTLGRIIRRLLRFSVSAHKKQELSIFLRKPSFVSYPKSACVEVAGVCNLRCPVCEYTNISKREKGKMSLGAFEKIIEEIGPHLGDLTLSGGGEPFINENIYEMLRLAREKSPKAYIYTDTNGHFMDAKKLLDAPPDEIVFSIDGFDQDTFAQYRVNGDYQKVLTNLRACIAEKRKRGAAKPKIVVKFICMRHNEHQVNMVERFMRDEGADDYRIELFTSRTVRHAREFMSSRPEYQNYDLNALNRGELVGFMKQLKRPCPMLWGNTDIYWNGDVVPCCVDYNSIFSWGNVLEAEGFWPVWNGEKARRFRKEHQGSSYRDEISICKDCYLTNCVLDDNREQKIALDRAGRSSTS